ncbi:pentapeptide repeat-containing protein [Faecalibacterium prausnitzii]|uniref:pentapeptide repeat-containing protein n=1 Tax=Faecalibacterium prausnitzii TaxID=853 RepID=UPI001A9A2F7C|nr:pentapeptide repeat-containing protein [Faecalibacterium prausnitzii]
MSEIIKGFKVFNPDWTCSPNGNTKQYTCPGKFEEDVTPVRCGQGMHFCKVAADCFNYYDFNPDNHVAEVAAYGEVVEEGDKCATNKLEIIREIPWAELLEMVNTGKGCAGLCNSGNRNSGNCNSGNWNSGNRNSGNWNSGNWNSGNCNSGDWNSGDWNSGNWNSGNWNNTNFSNGCFNTVEPKIHLFNKPSEWTYRDWLNSDARYLLNQIPGDVLEYIWFENMTDEEKEVHPEAETTGGYLKELDNSECAVIWWRSLDQRKKNVIMAIPNFDKAIFKEITGIDVDAD